MWANTWAQGPGRAPPQGQPGGPLHCRPADGGRRAVRHRPGPPAIPTTTLWPRRSTRCSRPSWCATSALAVHRGPRDRCGRVRGPVQSPPFARSGRSGPTSGFEADFYQRDPVSTRADALAPSPRNSSTQHGQLTRETCTVTNPHPPRRPLQHALPTSATSTFGTHKITSLR